MRSLPVRALSLAAIVAGSFVLAMGARAGGEKNLVGETPPEIQAAGWLNTLKPKPVSLAGLKGKVVVVEFWATWCPPCRRSIPHLIQLHDKYAKDGVVIIGLSDEPKETVEPFAQKMKMNYIVGYGSKTGGAYGVDGIPTAFVIGPDGKVVWSGHPMDENFEKTIEGLAKKKG